MMDRPTISDEFATVRAFAVLALGGALVINLTAMLVAMLTANPLMSFAAGCVVAVLAMGASYLCQVMILEMQPGDDLAAALGLRFVAIVLWAASLLCFMWGAYLCV